MINVLKTELPELKEYVKYLEKIWEKSWVTNNGDFVLELEKKLASFLDVKYLVLLSNGTIAIDLALRSLELQGEVITTPFTFAATTNCILWENLTPVFADVDPKTFNIDPIDVEKKITNKTTAILAVHVYGNPCDVEALQKLAQKYNLKLIYDAAHAFSVEYKNKSIFTYGDMSTLSFHATKVFHTIEGGAVTTNDAKLYEKLKLLRNFGIQDEEHVVLPGTNGKMNEFQAAMGLCNLPLIGEKYKKRQKVFDTYNKLLGNNPVIQFQHIIASKYNFSYMPICLKDKKTRDLLYNGLMEYGIKGRKYFYPLTTDFDYYKKLGKDLTKKYNLKNAKNISDRVICLPMYSSLDEASINKIAKAVLTILS